MVGEENRYKVGTQLLEPYRLLGALADELPSDLATGKLIVSLTHCLGAVTVDAEAVGQRGVAAEAAEELGLRVVTLDERR